MPSQRLPERLHLWMSSGRGRCDCLFLWLFLRPSGLPSLSGRKTSFQLSHSTTARYAKALWPWRYGMSQDSPSFAQCGSAIVTESMLSCTSSASLHLTVGFICRMLSLQIRSWLGWCRFSYAHTWWISVLTPMRITAREVWHGTLWIAPTIGSAESSRCSSFSGKFTVSEHLQGCLHWQLGNKNDVPSHASVKDLIRDLWVERVFATACPLILRQVNWTRYKIAQSQYVPELLYAYNALMRYCFSVTRWVFSYWIPCALTFYQCSMKSQHNLCVPLLYHEFIWNLEFLTNCTIIYCRDIVLRWLSDRSH